VYAEEVTKVTNENVKEIETGKCGDNATYTIDRKNKKITISGKGAMWDDPKIPITENDDIEEIVVEEGITVIGKDSFYRMHYKQLDYMLGDIDYYMLGDIDSFNPIKNVELPSTLTEIHSRAFTNVLYIKVPESVNRVDYDAFDGVKTIEIMGDMIGYEENAITPTFSGVGRTKIILHGSADDLEKAKKNIYCDVEIAKDNEKIKLKDYLIVSKDESIIYGIQDDFKEDTLKISDKVKKIQPYFFSKRIYSVKKVVLGNNVEEIGKFAFANNNIESVEFNNKLEKIGEGAFRNNNILEVAINSNVNYENNVFDDYVRIKYKTNFKDAQVVFNAVDMDKKSVFVRYNRIDGANGYEVEVSKGNKKVKYTTTKTIFLKDLSKIFRNPDNIKINVRAYKLKGKKKIYSASNSIILGNEDVQRDYDYCELVDITSLDKFRNSLTEIDGQKVYIGPTTSSKLNKKGVRVYHPIKNVKFPEVNEDYIVVNGAKYSVDGKTLLSAPLYKTNVFVKEGVEKINLSAILVYPDIYGLNTDYSEIVINNIVLPKSLKKIVNDKKRALNYKLNSGNYDECHEWDYSEISPKHNTVTGIYLKGTKLSVDEMKKLVSSFKNVNAYNFVAPKKVAKNSNDLFIYKNHVLRCSGTNKKIVVPEGVTEICENVNDNYDYRLTYSLQEIVLPKTLKKIDKNAFKDSMCLQKVTISKGSKIKKIDEDAFEGCYGLNTIKLLENSEIEELYYSGFIMESKDSKIILMKGSKINKIKNAFFYRTKVKFICKTKLRNIQPAILDGWIRNRKLTFKITKIVGASGYEIKVTNGSTTKVYRTKKTSIKMDLPKNLCKANTPTKISVRAYKGKKSKKVYSAQSEVIKISNEK
nr:leucine-rich repeat domain-containing protein [Acetatifactor sp.]